MTYLENYKKWLESPVVDAQTKEELKQIAGDEEQIESRFIGLLTFGTAGLRGILGAGLNRMNVYTVRHATQGMAELIKREGPQACARGVAVAYDSRIMSREFSQEVCCVLAANGIKCWLFDSLRPTPELSYAIRKLNCIAGINITASHNPKEYNGYKAYWSDGIQLSPEQAKVVFDTMSKMDVFEDVKVVSFDQAQEWITVLDEDFDEFYMQQVLAQTIRPDVIRQQCDLSIVYTPFHGAGLRLVPEVLARAGFENVHPVEQQMIPDGTFPTVKSPNPENKEGFQLAIELAEKLGSDLIIGTDPDSDRMGIVVRKSDGEYVAVTGNQTGVILLQYILSSYAQLGSMPKNPLVVKTIVTSELASRICERYGAQIVNVLTGFKFIGEQIEQCVDTQKNTFVMGYEESYGYLVGTYARDKDGVVASLLIAEAAAYYRSRGMTLWDALCEIYAEYGYHMEQTVNLYMEGLDGKEKMKKLMAQLRDHAPAELGGIAVKEVRDYSKGILGLPKSDVLYYVLQDQSVVVVRPSGTEPKVKIYIMVSAKDEQAAQQKVNLLGQDLKQKYL